MDRKIFYKINSVNTVGRLTATWEVVSAIVRIISMANRAYIIREWVLTLTSVRAVWFLTANIKGKIAHLAPLEALQALPMIKMNKLANQLFYSVDRVVARLMALTRKERLQ